MEYEGMVYRPPSEAYSLIIQVTIGCSQNDCIFCNMYKEKRFRMRPLQDVLADFREARAYYSSIGKIFLADGDALICKNEYLNEILNYTGRDTGMPSGDLLCVTQKCHDQKRRGTPGTESTRSGYGVYGTGIR